MQDFPYNFEPGMQHHNIWCTRPLSDKELAEVRGILSDSPACTHTSVTHMIGTLPVCIGRS